MPGTELREYGPTQGAPNPEDRGAHIQSIACSTEEEMHLHSLLSCTRAFPPSSTPASGLFSAAASSPFKRTRTEICDQPCPSTHSCLLTFCSWEHVVYFPLVVSQAAQGCGGKGLWSLHVALPAGDLQQLPTTTTTTITPTHSPVFPKMFAQ